MFKAVLALLAVCVAQGYAETICRIAVIGPAIGELCPAGYSRITSGDCCSTAQVTTVTRCVDKTNANGVSDCNSMKAYCNNSFYRSLMIDQCPKTCGFCTGNNTPCVDLTNPNTGKSECAQNIGLCNNSLYRDMMKTQCPKTCGYCR